MTSEPTRAEKMAAQYGAKLEELTNSNPGSKGKVVNQFDKPQTLEQKERLRKAKAKLADFRDLVR